MRRAGVEKKKRKHLLAYMDEFQNFVTASFPTTLEEMRKYHFHLVVATQFVGQNMPTEYVRSLLGNTKLLIGAESDPASNQVLGEIMGMDKPKGDYVKLPKHHLWVFDKTRERKRKYDYKLRPKKFKVPKVIANMQSNLYLTNAELGELFVWLVNES